MDPYLAQILLFASNFAIRGWQLCNGQIMSIAQNTAVFSLLGTTYGGDGVTTFQLPDLRGRVPIGFGQGQNLQDYMLGQVGGTETTILTLNNLPAHTHTATLTGLTVAQSASTAAATTNIPGNTLVPATLPTIGGGPSATTIKGYAAKDNTTTLASNNVSGSITINPTGNSLPFSIQNPYLAMNYQIATVGIFPSRN
jgi:microcystin-dependent protein